jgi:glutamine cyclotransferase
VTRPTILRVIGHDSGAHTQGLAYADGHLYESTGLVGASTLRRLDTRTGDVLQTVNVPNAWAEGIAVSAGGLTQITYTDCVATRYRLPTLDRERSFHYPGEGWGLAAVDEGYVMSDGSDTLRFLNGSFELLSKLQVCLAGRPLAGLNDLECVDQSIFACVIWHSDIYEIDKQSGDVVRLVDCSEITAKSGRSSYEGILNGIAFAPDRNSFFLTGKHWPSIFEIRIGD